MVIAAAAEQGPGANTCLGRAVLEAGDVLEPDTHPCNAKISGGAREPPECSGGRGRLTFDIECQCVSRGACAAQSAPVVSMKNSFGDREWPRNWSIYSHHAHVIAGFGSTNAFVCHIHVT